MSHSLGNGLQAYRKVLVFLTLMALNFCACAQQTLLDSLKNLVDKAPVKKKIEAYTAVITRLWRNHPDTALVYAKHAIKFANQLNEMRAKAIAVRLYGGTHYYLGNYDSSISYAREAYSLSVSAGDSSLIASCLSNIGLNYVQMGNYPEAVENLLNSYHIKKRIGQTYALGITLSNIGLVYIKLKDFVKAREYLNEAMIVSDSLRDFDAKLYASNNLGFTYLYSGQLSEAEKYFEQSIKTAERLNNTSWGAVAWGGLGQVSLQRNQWTKARKFFDQSLRLYFDLNDRVGTSEIYYLIAKIQLKKGLLDSAFYYVKKSRRFGEATGSRERRLDNFKLLEDLFTKRGRYDSAWFYKSRYVELRDSMFNESMARTLANIEVKIAEEQAGQAIAARDSMIQQKTTQTYFLIAIVAIGVLFFIILFIQYKSQSRLSAALATKNTEITNQNEEIRVQKEALLTSHEKLEKAQKKIEEQNKELERKVDTRTKELEVANKELEVANLELDNFIYKSSHDIKGPLARLLGVCNVALMDIKDQTSLEYFSRFRNAAQHVNDLFDRLKLINDINSVEVKNIPVSLNRIVEAALGRLKGMENLTEINIDIDSSADVAIMSDPFLLETVFFNILENSVRFQKPSNGFEKKMSVKAVKLNRGVSISFVDNGRGISNDNQPYIFQMFSKAALEHHTIGLGLYTVKQCLNKLHGSISLIQSNEYQTEFEVVI